MKSDIIDDTLREKVDEYTRFITDEKRGALAEYVTRRKAVIDLFEKFLEYRDDEARNYQKEDAIHRLVCPMRIDSHTLEIEDHNLWLLDDRLAFYRFFASDKEVRSYTGLDDRDRPDLAFFYDTCVAWREGENCETVVLVEFKKPMRDDYTSGRDPVQQILHYAKRLRTEPSIPDVKGRAIRGINSGTAFHCYVVADLTPTLDASIIGRFSRTPDQQGYFGYSPDPPAFVEIVPYGKILKDSKIRNTIFFKNSRDHERRVKATAVERFVHRVVAERYGVIGCRLTAQLVQAIDRLPARRVIIMPASSSPVTPATPLASGGGRSSQGGRPPLAGAWRL